MDPSYSASYDVPQAEQDSLTSGIDKIQDKINKNLVTEFQGFSSDLAKLKAQCDQRKREQKSLLSEIQRREETVRSLDIQIAQLQQKHDAVQFELSQVMAELDEYNLIDQSTTAAAEHDVEGKRVRRAYFSGHEAGLKQGRDEATAERERLEAEVAHEQQISDGLRARIGRLESRLKEKEREVEEWKQRGKNLDAEKKGKESWATSELERSRKEWRDMKDARDQAIRGEKDAERKLEKVDERRIDAEERAAVAEKELVGLKEELERVKAGQMGGVQVRREPSRALQMLSPNRLRLSTPNQAPQTNTNSPTNDLILSSGTTGNTFSLSNQHNINEASETIMKSITPQDYKRLYDSHQRLKVQHDRLREQHAKDLRYLKQWKAEKVERDEAKKRKKEEKKRRKCEEAAKRDSKEVDGGQGETIGEKVTKMDLLTLENVSEGTEASKCGEKQEAESRFQKTIPDDLKTGNVEPEVQKGGDEGEKTTVASTPTPVDQIIDDVNEIVAVEGNVDVNDKIKLVNPPSIPAQVDLDMTTTHIPPSRQVGHTTSTHFYPKYTNPFHLKHDHLTTDSSVSPKVNDLHHTSEIHDPRPSLVTPVSKSTSISTKRNVVSNNVTTPTVGVIGQSSDKRKTLPQAARVTPWLGSTIKPSLPPHHVESSKRVGRAGPHDGDRDSFKDDLDDMGSPSQVGRAKKVGEESGVGKVETPIAPSRSLVRDRVGSWTGPSPVLEQGSVPKAGGGDGEIGGIGVTSLRRAVLQRAGGTALGIDGVGDMDSPLASKHSQPRQKHEDEANHDIGDINNRQDTNSNTPSKQGSAKSNLVERTRSTKRKVDTNFDFNPDDPDPRERAIQRKKIAKMSVAQKREFYAKYKGNGRYVAPSDIKRTAQDEYEIDPSKNDGVKYRFHEVRRGREERRQMHGGDCECCRDYYEAVGPIPKFNQAPLWNDPLPSDKHDVLSKKNLIFGKAVEEEVVEHNEEIEDHRNRVSRHREVWRGQPTPPDFWNINFPTTQGAVEMNAKADQIVDERDARIRREAAHKNSKWRKK